MAKAKKSEKSTDVKSKKMTKASLKEYIAELADLSASDSESKLQCMIAMNEILSSADTISLLDNTAKDLLRQTWSNLKNEGVQLVDPPLLFGLPDGFEEEVIPN